VQTDRAFNSVFAPVRENGDKEAGEVCPHTDEMVIHGVGTANARLHITCLTKIFMSPPAESDEDERHLYTLPRSLIGFIKKWAIRPIF
jgi:hypothetical protein